jgi:phage baseplate assembly protein gpV
MIDTILERLDALEYLAANLKTRIAAMVRTGVVKSFDPATNAAIVNLGDDDSSFLTHPVPVFTHAGTGADWRPLKAGQQVTLLSSDGDLANAVAIPGGFHDRNPAPSSSASEDLTLARGTVRARATDTLIETVADASSAIRVQQNGWVTATVKGTAQFVIFDADSRTYFTIAPSALVATAPPPNAQ